MRIGIDFGTTRIVVAASDRGNYPLVNFEGPDGQVSDWFPSVLAVKSGTRLYGWEALAKQDDVHWTIVRSLKRWLRNAGPHTELEVTGESTPLRVLLTEMMSALRVQLIEHSNLGISAGEPLEAMLGVPANANSNQRFLTEEAARTGGFQVLGLLNEPSAAAIEFAYRNSTERKSRTGSGLAVYDLGGGTFDVSLVELGEGEHTVVSSDGIPNLGGDDFDQILSDLALETAGLSAAERAGLSAYHRNHLLEECREKKESLNPNTRKITIDLERMGAGWKEVTLPVDTYYERCRPLIESTRLIVEKLLAENESHALDTLYVTGGGSELPPVARVLRESFGRRVRRSAYMRSASAVGLAIRASEHGDRLREQLTENFGLWRESDAGGNIVFDLIFPRGAKLPAANEPALEKVRAYQPVHNIGHFRYLECSHVSAEGEPTGEITNWDEIRFPFEARLQKPETFANEAVERLEAPDSCLVREKYSCDASGNLKVTISTDSTGFMREYRIGYWAKDKAASR